MIGGKRSAGYTIVEVMIVLAVSGMMFVIAANFINGKQAKTAFTQGVNETASRMQAVLGQVVNGHYSDVPLQCQFNGTTISFGSGTRNQGENPQCVFLGKIVHLRDGNDLTSYEVFSIAGGRVNGSQPITRLEEADPTIVDALTLAQTVPQHLDVENVVITRENGSRVPSFAVGLLQTQGTAGDASGALDSGAQSVRLYYLTSAANPTASFNSSTVLAPQLERAQSATICLSDGSRHAEVRIGSNGSQLNVSTKMNGNARSAICSA